MNRQSRGMVGLGGIIGICSVLLIVRFGGMLHSLPAIRQCRAHVEWCKVEQPRLYDALFGKVEK